MPEEIGPDDPRYPSDYGYNRCRQLEGTYPEDAGCWNVTWQRVLCGWGTVTQEDWKKGEPEPPSIDEKAKKDRTLTYVRVRDSTQCVRLLVDPYLLNHPHPFTAAFEIWDQWYTAKDGRISDIPEDLTPEASHSVTMLQHLTAKSDPNLEALEFANTWGLKWGHEGLGMMTRQYFDKWLIDSWIPIFRKIDNKHYIHKGLHLELLNYKSPLGLDHSGGWLRNTDIDEKIGWFSCCQGQNYWDIEELYVKPEYRGRGYARLLMVQIKNMAEFHNLPIRLWVSYADSYEENHPVLLKVASFLGLGLDKAPVTWAGYVGKPGSTSDELPSIRIPARPKAIRDKNEHPEEEADEVVFSDELEEYLWSRKGRKARIRKSWEDD